MKFIKDTSWNLISFCVPIFIAIPILGMISRLMGVERFGLFTLILAIFGYSSVFDLGLSSAIVRVIAINKNNLKIVKEYLSTATIFLGLVSIFPLFLMAYFSENLVDVLNISSDIYPDAKVTFELLSLVFPLLILTTIWQSYLEGNERFKELSLIKTLSSICMSIFPLLLLMIEQSLTYSVIGIIIARLFSMILIISYTIKDIGFFTKNLFIISRLKELFRFGGWLTITNIISPIMSSMDRFILSSMSGAEKVAFYTAPAEIVGRMLIIPGIISKTAFPRLVRNNEISFKTKLKVANSTVALGMLLPVFIFSGEILNYWLGAGYDSSSITLKILLIGLFFNASAQVSYTSIQAGGYSKLAAFVHLFEVIPYLIALYYFVQYYSYNGAAIAWSARMAIDFIAFMFLEKKIIKH